MHTLCSKHGGLQGDTCTGNTHAAAAGLQGRRCTRRELVRLFGGCRCHTSVTRWPGRASWPAVPWCAQTLMHWAHGPSGKHALRGTWGSPRASRGELPKRRSGKTLTERGDHGGDTCCRNQVLAHLHDAHAPLWVGVVVVVLAELALQLVLLWLHVHIRAVQAAGVAGTCRGSNPAAHPGCISCVIRSRAMHSAVSK